jgi:steroid delta-isomerase-like uncharacterized protein
MATSNADLARQWFEEVWNNRRCDIIDKLLTPESICYSESGPICGPEEFRQLQYQPFVTAFPDLRVTVDAVISEGDEVAIRWTATGTHTGDGLGFPATQEAVSFCGITWVVARDGKMCEGWQNSNIPEVFRGLAAKALAS